MSDEDSLAEGPIEEAERLEAEALAHALERGTARDGMPERALETAAMLRYSADGGVLAADREEALLGDVLEVADRLRHAEPTAPRRGVRWMFGLLGAGAAVAVVLLFLLQPAPEAALLPTPSAALVSAQLDRTQGDDTDFTPAMVRYRGEVIGALREHYRER